MNYVDCKLTRLMIGAVGTFGIFEVPELQLSYYSLELPWRDNAPMISSIPPQTYVAKWGYSNKHKRHLYRLQNTDPRTGIEIHSANWGGDTTLGWYSELAGCIALGTSTAVMTNPDGKRQYALRNSRAAVARLENLADRRPLKIDIINALNLLYFADYAK
jgi:Family of unknown function (DUF5675)